MAASETDNDSAEERKSSFCSNLRYGVQACVVFALNAAVATWNMPSVFDLIFQILFAWCYL